MRVPPYGSAVAFACEDLEEPTREVVAAWTDLLRSSGRPATETGEGA